MDKTVSVTCKICKNTHEDDRELLISGTCGECFDKMFKMFPSELYDKFHGTGKNS